MAEELGQVVITRPQGVWRDVARKYVIKVDGVRAGTLSRGSTLALLLPAGEHRVQGRLDVLGSRVVSVIVPSGGKVHLTLEPAGNSLQMYQLFFPRGYLRLTFSGS